MADQERPNQATNKEPAEGSRENVNPRGSREGTGEERAGSCDMSGMQPDEQCEPPGSERGSGITNRPLGEEQAEQAEVPPRGERKDDDAHS